MDAIVVQMEVQTAMPVAISSNMQLGVYDWVSC